MTDVAVVNVSIGTVTLFGFTVLCLVHCIDDTSRDKSWNLFLWIIVLAYLGVIFDNISCLFDGKPQFKTAHYLMCFGSYLFTPLIMILFRNYQSIVFIGETESSNTVKKILYATCVTDYALLIVLGATKSLFCIDESGHFVSYPSALITYVFPVFTVLVCLVENVSRKIPVKKKMPLFTFGIVPILSIVSLVAFPRFTFLYVLFFLNLILIYGTVQVQRGVELAEQRSKVAQQNKEISEQQMQIMISQIKPHFLYNTLTAIYQLCDIDRGLAQKTIRDFSGYLRANMDGIKSAEPIPFENELAHTKTYLEIELLRFGDILNVEYDIQCVDFKNSALTLQPIVENAVKYGIRSREEGGTVKIATARVGGKIFVTVHDDGMGFDVTKKKDDGRSHIGIENSRSRLKSMMNAELLIQSEIGVGTLVTIILEDKQ